MSEPVDNMLSETDQESDTVEPASALKERIAQLRAEIEELEREIGETRERMLNHEPF